MLEATTVLPEWFLSLQIILLGLLVGSFTNVIVSRFPWGGTLEDPIDDDEVPEDQRKPPRHVGQSAGQSVITPRSQCPKCQTPISWYDNIPVLSFLILRGRCRGCRVAISFRYPVIELLTTVLYFAAYQKFGFHPLLFIRDFPFLTMLIAITFIDLEHRLIPDLMSVGGTFYGLATAFLLTWGLRDMTILESVGGIALGFGFFYSMSWIYWRLTGRVGLGGGDIKLLAMLGAFLGPVGVLHSILISSVIGALTGFIWGTLKKTQDIRHFAIPYGPFLVIGALYYYLIGSLPWLQFTNPT